MHPATHGRGYDKFWEQGHGNYRDEKTLKNGNAEICGEVYHMDSFPHALRLSGITPIGQCTKALKLTSGFLLEKQYEA